MYLCQRCVVVLRSWRKAASLQQSTRILHQRSHDIRSAALLQPTHKQMPVHNLSQKYNKETLRPRGIHLQALSSSVQNNNSDLAQKKDKNHCVTYGSSDQESSQVSLSDLHNIGMLVCIIYKECVLLQSNYKKYYSDTNRVHEMLC